MECAANRVPLTARQWQAALLLLQGMTDREIGRAMTVKTKTAKLHVRYLCKKFQCVSGSRRVQCAVKLYRFLRERKRRDKNALPISRILEISGSAFSRI